MGVVASMGSVGDCYDNAMAESFFATLECELLDRRKFPTQAEARMAIFEYIEGWYNPHRRHSGSVTDHRLPSRGATNKPLETQAMNRPRNRGNSSSHGRSVVPRRQLRTSHPWAPSSARLESDHVANGIGDHFALNG